MRQGEEQHSSCVQVHVSEWFDECVLAESNVGLLGGLEEARRDCVNWEGAGRVAGAKAVGLRENSGGCLSTF